MPVDKNVIEDLTSFLRQTAGEGIRVVMVYSPEYIEGQQLILNRDSIVKIYRDISNKMSVPFLDYSSHPICYDKSCYNSPIFHILKRQPLVHILNLWYF